LATNLLDENVQPIGPRLDKPTSQDAADEFSHERCLARRAAECAHHAANGRLASMNGRLASIHTD
jgi:hypothetical protein